MLYFTNAGKSFKYVSNEAFFFLNFINCFEDLKNGQIIIDLVIYDSPDILNQMSMDKLRSEKFEVKDKSKLVRYVIPLLVNKNIDDIEKDVNLIQGLQSSSAKAYLEKDKIIRLEPHLICPEQGCEHPNINRKFQVVFPVQPKPSPSTAQAQPRLSPSTAQAQPKHSPSPSLSPSPAQA
jgi:hypothetical protein